MDSSIILYAATGNGLFYRYEGSDSWQQIYVSDQTNQQIFDIDVNPVMAYGRERYMHVAAGDAVYYGWAYPGEVFTSFTRSQTLASGAAESPAVLYSDGQGGYQWAAVPSATGGQKIYLGYSYPEQWTQVTAPGPWVFDFVTTPSYVYAATANGVYRSADDGQSWTLVSQGLSTVASRNVNLFIPNKESIYGQGMGDDEPLYVGTSDGVYFSYGGQYWSRHHYCNLTNRQILSGHLLSGWLNVGLDPVYNGTSFVGGGVYRTSQIGYPEGSVRCLQVDVNIPVAD